MFFQLDPRVDRILQGDRPSRDLEARIALAQSPSARPGSLRRLVGAWLIAAGSALGAEPPPRAARPSRDRAAPIA
jgi:hypothetical protein